METVTAPQISFALPIKLRPTKHAPEAGESAARFAVKQFSRLFIFPVGRLRHPRPQASTL